MIEHKCSQCGSPLVCMAGCSAHSSNWYCPICPESPISHHRSVSVPMSDSERLRLLKREVADLLKRCSLQYASRDRPPDKRWYLCNVPGSVYERLCSLTEEEK